MKLQSQSAENTTLGKYYKLMTDIDVTADEWVAIQRFEGCFDGNGHKITGKLVASDQVAFHFAFIGK